MAAVGDTFISNTSLNLLSVTWSIPSPLSASELFITDELGQAPRLIFSIFLLEHANILLPLCRTSYRPRHAVHGPFSHSERWKAEHVMRYLSDIAVYTNDVDKLLLKYAKALTDKDGSWYTAQTR